MGQSFLLTVAEQLSVPVVQVNLSGMKSMLEHCMTERSLLLIWPDQHVAWRGEKIGSLKAAKRIFQTVTGGAYVNLTLQPGLKQRKPPPRTTSLKMISQLQIL